MDSPPVIETVPPRPPLLEDKPAFKTKSPPFPLSPLLEIDTIISPAFPSVADPVSKLITDPVPELLVPV